MCCDCEHSSVILQGALDHKANFTDIYIGWPSRARKKRALERAANNVNQTDYYGIIDEIQHLTQHHEILTALKKHESYEPSFSAALKQMLKKMLVHSHKGRDTQKY